MNKSKREEMKKKGKKMTGFCLLIIYILCSSFGVILIRKGSIQSSIAFLDGKIFTTISPMFLIGFILYLISFLSWIYIIQIFPVTYISPVAYGMIYILICVLSFLFFKEVVKPKTILGSIMIVIGIILASAKE